jgi:protein-disulfide isomerase
MSHTLPFLSLASPGIDDLPSQIYFLRGLTHFVRAFKRRSFRRFSVLVPPLLSLFIASLLTLVFGPSAGAAKGGDILAEMEGAAIDAQAVEGALATQLAKLEEQIYELKRKKLEEMIAETLLRQEAQRRGIPLEELLNAEVTAKAGLVMEQEVESFYQQNRAKLRGGEKAVRERIRSSLQAQRTAAQREAFLRQLRAEHRVVVHLQPPRPLKVVVTGREGAAVKGPPGAPVVIVAFSDFQCPYSRKALNELEKVLTAYPAEVQLVYRHFPIDRLHLQARLAAQAAECAVAEGRFWDYHDRLFDQTDLSSTQQLKELALELSLDLPTFERCLNEEWARTRVAQDVEAGTRAGVSGTPTFFINGRLLVGVHPFEAFKTIIEQELAALRQ